MFSNSAVNNIKYFLRRHFLLAGLRAFRPTTKATTTRAAVNLIKSHYYCRIMDAKLEAVPLVDIDDEGRFKYILIKVYGKEQSDGTEPNKLIVRGYKRAQWHGNKESFIYSYIFNVYAL